GFVFNGWQKEDGTSFNVNLPVNEDMRVHAIWTAVRVDYKIAVWAERIDVTRGNQTDAARNINNGKIDATYSGTIPWNPNARVNSLFYDQIGIIQKSNAVNAGSNIPTVAQADITAATNMIPANDRSYFETAAGQYIIQANSTTVNADGSTVINIYFRRKLLEMRFTVPNTLVMTVHNRDSNDANNITYGLNTGRGTYSYFVKLNEDINNRWPDRLNANHAFTNPATSFTSWAGGNPSGNNASHRVRATPDILVSAGATSFTMNSANGVSSQMLHYLVEAIPGDEVFMNPVVNTRFSVNVNARTYVFAESPQYTQVISSDSGSWSAKGLPNLSTLNANGQLEGSSDRWGYAGPRNNGDAQRDFYFIYSRGAGHALRFSGNVATDKLALYTPPTQAVANALIPEGAAANIFTKPRNYTQILYGESLEYYEPLSEPTYTATTDDGKQYQFAGWYTSPQCLPGTEFMIPDNWATEDAPKVNLFRLDPTSGRPATMPTTDLTLYARWVPVPYTLKISDPENGPATEDADGVRGVLFYRTRNLFERIGSPVLGNGATDYTRDSALPPMTNPYDVPAFSSTVAPLASSYVENVTALPDGRKFLGWHYAIGIGSEEKLTDETELSGGISNVFALYEPLKGDIHIVYQTPEIAIKYNWGSEEYWPWSQFEGTVKSYNTVPELRSESENIVLRTPVNPIADLYYTNDQNDNFIGWELGYYITSGSEAVWSPLLDNKGKSLSIKDVNGRSIDSGLIAPDTVISIKTLLETAAQAVTNYPANSIPYSVLDPTNIEAKSTQYYAAGKYVFFRPVFKNDKRYGIIYEYDPTVAYVDISDKYDANSGLDPLTAEEFNAKFSPYNGGNPIIPDELGGAKLVGWKAKTITSIRPEYVEKFRFNDLIPRSIFNSISKGFVFTDAEVNELYAPYTNIRGPVITLSTPGGSTNVPYGVPYGNYIVLQPLYEYTITFDFNAPSGEASLKVPGVSAPYVGKYEKPVNDGEVITSLPNNSVLKLEGGTEFDLKHGRWNTVKNPTPENPGVEWYLPVAGTAISDAMRSLWSHTDEVNYIWFDEESGTYQTGLDVNGNTWLESGNMTLYAQWDVLPVDPPITRPSRSELAYAYDDSAARALIGTTIDVTMMIYVKTGVLVVDSGLIAHESAAVKAARYKVATDETQRQQLIFSDANGIPLRPEYCAILDSAISGTTLTYDGETERNSFEGSGRETYHKYTLRFSIEIASLDTAIMSSSIDRLRIGLDIGAAFNADSNEIAFSSSSSVNGMNSAVVIYPKGLRKGS
ncbi:MAG: hypothetical protein LBC65_05285, partial [Oscillospiraceae bacterium]|nr:hypothetical protein [Oscillospiraceae bacterium]